MAIFRSGDLEVDLAARVVKKAGREVRLTPIEYALLRLLVTHAGKILTHRQLLTEVWGPNAVTQTHYLRVHIAHLREKLEDGAGGPRDHPNRARNRLPAEGGDIVIRDLVRPELVFGDLDARTRDDALATLARSIAACSAGVDGEQLLETLRQRERQATTAFGDGVAIPHARLPGVERMIVAFATQQRRHRMGCPRRTARTSRADTRRAGREARGLLESARRGVTAAARRRVSVPLARCGERRRSPPYPSRVRRRRRRWRCCRLAARPLGVLGETIPQHHPRQASATPRLRLRRELARVVERGERHVQLLRPFRVRVSERGAAAPAKLPDHVLGGSIRDSGILSRSRSDRSRT